MQIIWIGGLRIILRINWFNLGVKLAKLFYVLFCFFRIIYNRKIWWFISGCLYQRAEHVSQKSLVVFILHSFIIERIGERWVRLSRRINMYNSIMIDNIQLLNWKLNERRLRCSKQKKKASGHSTSNNTTNSFQFIHNAHLISINSNLSTSCIRCSKQDWLAAMNEKMKKNEKNQQNGQKRANQILFFFHIALV